MAPQSGPKTQYQHFVPQFLLRNFSHPYVDPDSATLPRGKKARRRNGELVPGDAVVSSAALSEDPIALTETPVRRILGQMDMYNDTGHPQAPNHIEKMFGDIESRVSTIFRKITKAFAAKDVGLWLTRAERNDVRKFLFLLKYRGWGFYKRFNHNAPEEYNSDDRDLFLEYMAQRGFTRPIDVWFDNLKAIMELKMDVEGEWMSKIRKRIYFQDAEWFVKHTQFFYMAVCTPEEPSHEFIITDGCYNVFEGRSTFAKDLKTGEIDPTEWINFHEFTPISPKLMIVLRSCLFPSAEEDVSPRLKQTLKISRDAAVNNIYGPGTLENSLLFRLPIEKAKNSYTTMVNGVPRLAYGEDGSHKASHRFFFRFFPISKEYIHKINGIFLDNSHDCKHAVFFSKESFIESLEWYMTAKPDVIGKRVVGVTEGDKRRRLLEKLDALLKLQGSREKSVWDDAPIEDEYHREFHRMWMLHINRDAQGLTNDPSYPINPLLKIYTILGGSATMFWHDLEQSKRMWTLRVKIDSWSQGVDEYIRRRNRNLVTAAYLRCPPFRFWLYMKLLKFIVTKDPSALLRIGSRESKALEYGFNDVEDAEDIIATARIINYDADINQLIYATVTNEIEMRKHPGLKVWQRLSPTWLDLPRFLLMHKFVFQIPGSICGCGIPEIELYAQIEEQKLQSKVSIDIQGFDTSPFSEDQVIEIVTRIKVREIFVEILKERMKLEHLQKLKKVFFELTYPTPPTI